MHIASNHITADRNVYRYTFPIAAILQKSSYHFKLIVRLCQILSWALKKLNIIPNLPSLFQELLALLFIKWGSICQAQE